MSESTPADLGVTLHRQESDRSQAAMGSLPVYGMPGKPVGASIETDRDEGFSVYTKRIRI
jgi:hypothetical protein